MAGSDRNVDCAHSSHRPQIYNALFLVLLIALAVRLVAVGRPLLANFATRDVVHAMMARNLVEGRASFWLPRVDCLCGGQRGLHLVELPLSAYLAGGLWKTLGGSLDVWGRVVSIGFSVAAVAVLFDLVRRRYGHSAGLGAAAVLALSPVAVIYGQHFMLESSVVFFSVATIDALDRWLSGRRAAWLAVAAAAFALLVMTKIYMLVLFLPIGYMSFVEGDGTGASGVLPAPWGRRGRDARGTRLLVGTLFVLAALPAIAWVAYVMHVASPGGRLSEEVYYSLSNSADAHPLPHPLLAQAAFYRRLFDDLAGVVLTPVAFMLPLIGLLDRAWRRWAVWLAAMGLLVVLIPRKFFEMNYYWLVALPPLAIMAGLGWAYLAERLRPSRAATAILLVVALAASLRYAAGPLLCVPEEDRAVLPAAEIVRGLAAEGEPVATIHGSGIDLLYYCDRPGWALEPDDPALANRLAECRRWGAKLLVIVDVDRPKSPDQEGDWAKAKPIAKGDGFRVYKVCDLVAEPQLSQNRTRRHVKTWPRP